MDKLLEIRGLSLGVLLLGGLIYAVPGSAPALAVVLLAMLGAALLRELLWADHMQARRAERAARRRAARRAATSPAAPARPSEAEAAHLRRVAEGDAALLANYLVAPGWVRFLRSMPPDVELWHQIATEMRGMAGDRLDAAFWILEQPACDRATAWQFIAGAACQGLLAQDGRFGHDRLIPRWNVAVTRWNAGFYRCHALAPDGPGAEALTPERLEQVLAALDSARGGGRLPRPTWPQGLERPGFDLAHSTRSPFSFAAGPGLYRRYRPRQATAAQG